MYRDELLKHLKKYISPRHYAALEVWTKKREHRFFGLLKRKFDVVTLPYGDGFSVSIDHFGHEFIHVYND